MLHSFQFERDSNEEAISLCASGLIVNCCSVAPPGETATIALSRGVTIDLSSTGDRVRFDHILGEKR
jgi:hypothetical protein